MLFILTLSMYKHEEVISDFFIEMWLLLMLYQESFQTQIFLLLQLISLLTESKSKQRLK